MTEMLPHGNVLLKKNKNQQPHGESKKIKITKFLVERLIKEELQALLENNGPSEDAGGWI